MHRIARLGARRGVVTSSSTLNIPIPCSALSPDICKNWRTLHPCNIKINHRAPLALPGSSNYSIQKEHRRNLTFYVGLCQKLHNQYAPEIEDGECRTAIEKYAEKCMDLVVVCATTGAYILRQNINTAEIHPLLDNALSGVYKDSDAARTIHCLSELQFLLGAIKQKHS